MYDNTAQLMHETGRIYDAYANEYITYEPREVFVYVRSVYNSEFYRAAQIGLHPSITLTLANRYDYDNEKIVIFDGVTYDVIRADWNAQRDKISLVLEERLNVTTPSYTLPVIGVGQIDYAKLGG